MNCRAVERGDLSDTCDLKYRSRYNDKQFVLHQYDWADEGENVEREIARQQSNT